MREHHRALPGRHEFGQNMLHDQQVIARIAALVAEAEPGEVLEYGAGSGAITDALVTTGRPVTAVEIDPRLVRVLRRRFAGRAEIVHADLLRHRPVTRGHHIVSNVPFHLTTPLLRGLLAADHWRTAVLLVQWEVARKRAGVGGATMLTAMWWPWYEFELIDRVRASAFRPAPSVDAGLLIMRRRDRPLVDAPERERYQHLVRSGFQGRGGAMAGILGRLTDRSRVSGLLRRAGLTGRELPRDLTAEQWARLFRFLPEEASAEVGRRPSTSTERGRDHRRTDDHRAGGATRRSASRRNTGAR